MARDVYSLRIFAHASLASSAGVVGPIVPAGLVYILRDVDVVEVGGTAPASMGVLNQVGGFLWAANRTVTGGTAESSWRGRQVYAEGERVGFETVSGLWAIAASGYQLTLP